MGANNLMELQPEHLAGDYGRTCQPSWSSTRGGPGAEPQVFRVSHQPCSLLLLARLFFAIVAGPFMGYIDPKRHSHQVVQSRPDRQGVGRDPSTNWTSVRIILSVPLISLMSFS